jgi:hypothetical protein
MEKAKYLFETTVLKVTDVPKTETRIENGEEVKVTKTAKEKLPIKVALAKPDRRRIKDADIFYAKTSLYLSQRGSADMKLFGEAPLGRQTVSGSVFLSQDQRLDLVNCVFIESNTADGFQQSLALRLRFFEEADEGWAWNRRPMT